jgi:hypothetical protein
VQPRPICVLQSYQNERIRNSRPMSRSFGRVFRLRPGVENEVYPVFGILLASHWPNCLTSLEKITVFSRFIVRPERLTKGAGCSKRPRRPSGSPSYRSRPGATSQGTPTKARKTRFTRDAWTMTASKKTKSRHLHDG